ncbi:uncharacterized protein At4g10930 isoform X2 [Andrographis paniculata]|uniref:uncharacterized protein At4g10930 isoform X2 n=1 Tax=Andrographis paniculata TaxID=175694 RepID=UPI0021E99F45|nr:uncharacterized protein At4g10930 isoform X2 [Andrographis paniculata]
MEVELVTDDNSEDENYGFDDGGADYSSFEGERCGICSDVVIDRGVLDCCQHWFCFTCIDNWATITSLCPLCQNEFQLITCVPVYDTVGGNKTDEDTAPRDDDWFIEGKNNTLSFPSYYIDENAVVCLDGNDCKIRSGLVAIEEDLDIDTSIACDFCDKWYHALCVGFDPESTSDSSWLCPRCITENDSKKSDRVSDLRKSYQSSFDISTGDFLAETSFSGRVSVSVADEGETAVVVSLVDRNQGTQKPSDSVFGCSTNVENTELFNSISNLLESEVLPGNEPKSVQDMELLLSQDNCFGALPSVSPPSEVKIFADDSSGWSPIHVVSDMTDPGLNLGLGTATGTDTSDMKSTGITEDNASGMVELKRTTEDPLSVEDMEPNKIEVILPKTLIADEEEPISEHVGYKRKQTESSDAHGNADDEETEVNTETRFSRKKRKAESSSQPDSLVDETSLFEEPKTLYPQSSSRDNRVKCRSEKESSTSVMDIVQGSDRKSLKQLGNKKSSDIRLKKIMRRAGEDQDSLVLVQEIRQKIREAARNKSSDDIRQKLFDPKLLDAFRTALAGSATENRNPTLDVKAKKALLQKGKIRESLTKKIYGAGGKRQRDWTRECEVEFWKHRCIKASKPEKIQTLQSVLDLLRDNSNSGKKKVPENDDEAKGSILSRLYLADSSVFPRKNDIKPVSALKAPDASEEKSGSDSTKKVSAPPPIDKSQAIVPPSNVNDTKKIEAHSKKGSSASRPPVSGSTKVSSEKNSASKPGDKRKWALELLARKTATSTKRTQDSEEDKVILKGHYPLLAQLPKDSRPVLASARHNKVPVSIRQAQLYRLAEHFLKKANLSTACRSAETELAVADAVNIEKQIADRSNSKLVYMNLCSQEIRKIPDTFESDRANESNPNSTSDRLPDEPCEVNNNVSLDSAVDEALRNAGLMSDSPPNSPDHPTEGTCSGADLSEKAEEEDGPENVIEADPHPDLDIYGDFEYNLEDDDFIGASSFTVSNQQQEEPKIKLLFSSLNSERLNDNPDTANHETSTSTVVEAEAGSSGLPGSRNEGAAVDNGVVDHVDDQIVRNSLGDNDGEPSIAECEELYGPDKEPIVNKYPETLPVAPLDLSQNNESLPKDNGDCAPKKMNNDSGQPAGNIMESLEPALDGSKQQSSDKRKTAKRDSKQSEPNSEVMKKVESYIKEHIRPLCKSGVITVEQYRWAVGKTTEKVMKYHAKEKNANFLIKEGEKVKKLASQYVEAAATQLPPPKTKS